MDHCHDVVGAHGLPIHSDGSHAHPRIDLVEDLFDEVDTRQGPLLLADDPGFSDRSGRDRPQRREV